VSRSAAFFASLLVTLGRPAWWLLALAGFLARGGILLVILPIVNLPSPLSMSNIVAPIIFPLALGRVDTTVVVAVAAVAGGLVLWLVVGGLVGAASDLALIRDGVSAAAEEGVTERIGAAAYEPSVRGGLGTVARILAVRLLAHIPFGIALVIATIGIVNVTYAELTRPADLATPLIVRIAVAAARPLAAILVAWFLGELAGGIAARRVVLNGSGVWTALRDAVVAIVRQPRSTLVPALAMTVVLLAILGGTLGGARIAWLRADSALTDPVLDPTTVVMVLVTFIAIWLAALALIGLIAAARSAAMTFEAVRRDASSRRFLVHGEPVGDTNGGTFGASAHHRPGDMPVDDDGGSL
jgi:hypothetical protein